MKVLSTLLPHIFGRAWPIYDCLESTIADLLFIEVMTSQSLVKVCYDLKMVKAIKFEFGKLIGQSFDIAYMHRAKDFATLEFPHLI